MQSATNNGTTSTLTVSGGGTNTLTLMVSEDAYLGDAQFTVAIDGQQVGGIQTATASHAAGQDQAFEIDGISGADPHVLSVTFLNDAYGGTPQMDRNLYVDGATYNGTGVSGGTLTLLGNGTQSADFGNTASVPVMIGTGSDTVSLSVSEDNYQGDAQFTVSVDGQQVGEVQTAAASHAAGQDQLFNVLGNFGSGPHTVALTFLNDAWGGSPSTDRNLYLDSASYNGTLASEAQLALLADGTQSVEVTQGVPATIQLGSGSDTIGLSISEDAYQGDAQFTVSVDGQQIGGTQTAQASHAAGQDQVFNISGDFGSGPHVVAVTFLNDKYDGSAATDRNLYVDQTSFDGQATTIPQQALLGNGTQSVTVNPTLADQTVGSGSDTISLSVSEDAYLGDAQFTVTVDGQQVGGVLTAEALHGAGQSQTFDIRGDFGGGHHVVGVTFLNDLWGGTADTDRNLYINSASTDGRTTQEGIAQLGDGTASFGVDLGTTYTLGAADGNVVTTGNDTVYAGAGALTVQAHGPFVSVVGGNGGLTFMGSSGNDTVVGGAGMTAIMANADTLSFTAGSGAAVIQAGSGQEIYDLVAGSAGGRLTITNFTPGLDAVHLEGYAGDGIASQRAAGPASMFTLTDGTQVILVGTPSLTAAQVFS